MPNKPLCKYGDKCYRKNTDHVQKYDHGKRKRDDNESVDDEDSPSKVKKVKIDDFFKKATDKPLPEKKNLDDIDDFGVKNAHPSPEKKNLEDFIKKDTGESSKYVRKMDTEISDSDSEEVSDTKESSNINDARTTNAEEFEVAKLSASDSSDSEMKDATIDEYTGILKDSEPVEQCMKRLYLVDMPPDFYNFWDFCKSLDPANPSNALKDELGLCLVGPYDILSGKCKSRKLQKGRSFLTHWRYYFDPPEFLTVLKGDDDDQFHIGYFRDDPADLPSFVASNSAKKNCIITPRGRNIFGAVNWFIDNKQKTNKLKSLTKLQNSLQEWAKNHDFVLDLKTDDYKSRQKKVVCETFHKAGLVVPVDPETEVGYREVPETPGDLKRMLKKIVDSKSEEERNLNSDPLQELITLVQFANDECDYGEGIELGLDIFSFGNDLLHPFILSLLPVGYQLLKRNAFGEIIKAHLKDRKKGSNLSVIERT